MFPAPAPDPLGTAMLFQELVRLAGGEVDLQAALTRGIETTQRYIDGDTDAQRRLVGLI